MGVNLTLIINNNSTLETEKNFKIIKLPFLEIEDIRYGRIPIKKYFNGHIFYTNSSGKHVNFDFTGFEGKWVSTCHGCEEWVGGSHCQIFVSNNQLLQHLRDNYFDSYSNSYRVIHTPIDINKLYFTDGEHNRIVWIGRIDGAKAERLYDIALNSSEKILAAGVYDENWKWLFDKIMETNNVEWVGKIDGDNQKRKFFSRAKLSIHCSTFEDPCPTTILESQACGVPVITYANGSMYEICCYKNLVFNNLKEFTKTLNSFGGYKETMTKELICFVENNFSAKEYGMKFYKVFNEVIS
jgi:glycosyltransferase involved in cell wall biosynthesis